MQRDDGPLQIEIRRKEKGCFVYLPEAQVEIDDYAMHSCLCHPDFQLPQYFDILYLYKMYNKGVMPCTGALLDQPNKLIDYFKVLDGLYNQLEEERLEKLKLPTLKK